ncbi:MAG TPA: UvrD-helicase domain-containing protein [Blastocatellia bacterium]|nr:UvrD-helicase domain-containing protein [Blastocatellia bacterium]
MKAIAKVARIAHYRILEPLGAGGMGAVYKAHDEKLDRVVAIKLLASDAVAHEDRRRRFLQEARAASALNHPHILTIYDIGEAEGKPFIAMEYIQGATLRAQISKKALSLKDALDIAIQVAEGLGKAHEHGIVHRDLKPENLMISRDGYAKILDFGLAKLIRQQKPVPINSTEKTVVHVKTVSGAIMGTIEYMSPEQILGRKVDHRSDVFSFGIVLYEMTTGKRPFTGENRIDTMHAILHEEPRPPHVIITDLPRDLHRIITKALAKEPKERYQSIKEINDEIKELKRSLETGRAPVPAKSRLVLKSVGATAQRPAKVDYEGALNEAQYRAVTTTEGPLLIVAGAGTGKTRTLVYRVARLVETGVRPESILLLTFTRRAAASMLARAAALADERCQRVSGGTFHSLAYSVLRKHADLAGIARSFTVLDQGDTEDVIELLRRQMGLAAKDRRFPRKRTAGAIFSMAVNKLIPIAEVLEREYPQYVGDDQDLAKLFVEFEQYKRERHLLGYDDLLTRFRDALENSEELRTKLSNQYRYVMVDEYQDTNRLQAQIVRLIASTHSNVAVVGDECQSIYSFRGASFHNMIEYPGLFPGAEIIKLEENFRSTQPVLDLANALMSDTTEGYAKQLFSKQSDGPPPLLVTTTDENEQSRFVAQRIEELLEDGVPLSEIAVLFRASTHSFDLEIELGKHRIPFRKYGGMKFAESAHIKDLLAFLRVVINPSDTLSWRRALKLVENVGDVTVEQILQYLSVERKEFRTAKAKSGLFKKLKQFPAKASYKDQLIRFAHLLVQVAELKTPRAQLAAAERYYRPILRARHDDHARRQREIEHLLTIAKRYRTGDELLADMALDPADLAAADTTSRGDGFVTLSTVHSAKGLEWDSLFVIWMMDGWFPSLRATDEFEDLDEEKRLLYVAATRAKRHLYFTCPTSTHEGYGSAFVSGLSRFLEGLPPSILARATLADDGEE